jgi:putative transposase
MARLLRVQFEGAIYHVTARGNERRVIFRDDADRERFLRNLAQAQQLHGVRLYLVCLMPNHFHVLSRELPAICRGRTGERR